MSIHTLAIIFAPGCIFLAAWVALGLQTRNYPSRNHGEGDGVGERVRHGQSNYNNLGAE